MATRDWLAIKTEYVTGEISLRDLATKHKISWGAMCSHALEENWNGVREDWRYKRDADVIQRATEAAVDRRYSALEVCDTIIDKFMRSVDLQKVGAFDVLNAARFREVLTGGISDRTAAELTHDWRAGKSAEEIAAVEEAARIVNEKRGV